MDKIKSFQDLNTWRESHKLVLFIYKSSEDFPSGERFGLTNQLRRASVSITSNIAEGFGRKSAKDKQHFYIMTKTSLAETQNQLVLAKDLKYINRADFESAYNQSVVCDKLIARLIKSAVMHT